MASNVVVGPSADRPLLELAMREADTPPTRYRPDDPEPEHGLCRFGRSLSTGQPPSYDQIMEQRRITIADLPKGVYDRASHHRLADRGRRRYNPYSFDFDSTPLSLDEPAEHWDEPIKKSHLENRARAIERLKLEYGKRNIEAIIQNTRDLGPKGMSLVTYHNTMHRQARSAFVVGAYYPALVAACALGERILNHLILDLRESFRSSPHYRKVFNKDAFDNWPRSVEILIDWDVLLPEAAENFLKLETLRHRSVHFNFDTYTTMREDALTALTLLGKIISRQFGYFGGQPWFIANTPGVQFIKSSFETHPFVRTYLIPASGFVGVNYGMDLLGSGWVHLDYADYGDGTLTDEEFANAERERDPKKVVTRAMIEAEQAEKGND
jgi:hypothetical protein